MLKEAESQGLLSWSPLVDYAAGAIVMGSDDELYQAQQASGPATSPEDPTADNDDTYWKAFSTLFGAPVATQTERGISRLATQAEVRAGAAASGSPEPAVLRVEDIASFPSALGGMMMYNTRTVLTTSGSWAAPVTGWYKLTCIGGGGGGASGNTARNGGGGGGAGGNTTFDGITASGGGGGGGGGGTSGWLPGTGGGGGSGEVIRGFRYYKKTSTITFAIGAGGIAGTGFVGQQTGGKGGGAYGGEGGGDSASGNGGWCGTVFGQRGHPGTMGGYQIAPPRGGDGAGTGLGYGGGGGGGGGNAGQSVYCFGVGQDGGFNGEGPSSASHQSGGAGGSGAVIIEYFNPNAATA